MRARDPRRFWPAHLMLREVLPTLTAEDMKRHQAKRAEEEAKARADRKKARAAAARKAKPKR